MASRRRAALCILGLGAAALVWIARPQACDYGVDGRLGFSSWLNNVAARLSGTGEDCDPWTRIAAKDLNGPILLEFSINAYAGPAYQTYLISPDGLVETWPDFLFQPDDSRSSRDYSYSFNDPDIYALARDRLAPLRGWSHPDSLLETLELDSGKASLTCGNDGYHGRYRIFWDGNVDWLQDGSVPETSYFEISLGENCPAAQAALGRLGDLKDAIDGELPPEIHESWFEIDRQLWEEIRQQP